MGFLPDGPHQLKVGLGRVPAWLELDEFVQGDLAARKRLVSERHDDVVAWLDADTARTSCAEAMHALSAAAGTAVADDGRHPMDVLAVSIADDVCVLDPVDHTLVAGAVCFPNRWALRDKLGHHVTDVHQPVPGYRDALASRVDTVLDRLRPGQVLERRNWSLLDDPAMHQPVAPPPARIDSPPTQVWARVERQTLVRLPETGAVVFTIRTRQRRLDDLDAGDRARLHSLLDTLDADTEHYKGLSLLRAPVLGWLAEHSG